LRHNLAAVQDVFVKIPAVVSHENEVSLAPESNDSAVVVALLLVFEFSLVPGLQGLQKPLEP